MTAHTPGPWAFRLKDEEPNEAFVTWPYGYASVHGARPGREANARLIAAAPELLEALINLRHGSDLPGGPTLLAMQEAADSAIAKATGKQA